METVRKNVVSVNTTSGQIFYVETTESVDVQTIGTGGQVAGGKAEAAIMELREVGDTIAEVCRSVYERIEQALGQSKPKEMELEFGVKLAGKAGIPLVTEGSAEATFKVNAKWQF